LPQARGRAIFFSDRSIFVPIRIELGREPSRGKGEELHMPTKSVPSGKQAGQVPQAWEDWALLYQTFTSLQKLTERALLPLGLSSPQVFLMGMLYWDPTPLVPARARSTVLLEAQSLSGLVDRLVNAGLLNRDPHPKDRRKVLLTLTDVGRERYLKADAVHREVAEAFFEGLTQREIVQWRRLAHKLRANGYRQLGLRPGKVYPRGE
jgi:DNA-binding MarR family transcriptional regulator